MNALTALASAAFGSSLYLTTFSAVSWLNQMPSRIRIAGLVVTVMVMCAVIGMIAFASLSVTIGFIVGAGMTPPVHRCILQRRSPVASS